MRYLGCGCGNDISVEGPSLKLKYLEIFYCHGLKCISISASKLNSFEFCGRDEDIDFISVPLLNEVSFTGAYTTRLIRDFKPILGFSSQLTKLTLNINYNTEVSTFFISFSSVWLVWMLYQFIYIQFGNLELFMY